MKIADATGREIRDLAVPANRNQAGIQTVCWDMRLQPIAPAASPAAMADRAAAHRPAVVAVAVVVRQAGRRRWRGRTWRWHHRDSNAAARFG